MRKRVSGAALKGKARHPIVCQDCYLWQMDAHGKDLKARPLACASCGGGSFWIFHSAMEARRHDQLRLLECAGEIADIELQPKFPLYAPALIDGKYKLIGNYIADAKYREIKTGGLVIEDVKDDVMTPLSAWKIKHAEAQYGIKINIVRA